MHTLVLPLAAFLIGTDPVFEEEDLRAVFEYAALAYVNAEKPFLFGTALIPVPALPGPEALRELARERRSIFVICPAGSPPSLAERSLRERLEVCETYGESYER